MNTKPISSIDKLLGIMALLRSPSGCPWDQIQTSNTLKPYLLEETHEVLAALEDGNTANIKDELGDLLLQIVFLTEIFSEKDQFTFADVAEAISMKLIRRHPHVFGDSTESNLEKLDHQWEAIKSTEYGTKTLSIVSGQPDNLPALLSAQKISKKVARCGFDWDDYIGVLEKIDEEITEIKEAIKNGNKKMIEAEIGDLLFSVVNLARHLEIDSETALLKMIKRFKGRFQTMEELLEAEKRSLHEIGPDELESFWQKAKTKHDKKLENG